MSLKHILAALGLALLTVVLAEVSVGSGPTSAARQHVTRKQLGINTYVVYDCQSAAVWSQMATTQVEAFKGLGANSIAIAFPLYTYSLNSNAFFARDVCNSEFETPTPTQIAEIVEVAHSQGLHVFLRPILQETDLRSEKVGAWRGIIDPTNTSEWFKNYWNTMLPYLTMARAYNVEHFAISTELQSMAAKPMWSSLIAKARRVYKGDLVFTTNWAPDQDDGVRWAGTSVGVDMYVPLRQLGNTATPSEIVAGWDSALATTYSFSHISSATISEIGILPQDGAYSQPYAWSLPLTMNPFNQSIQANWYTAACTFFRSHNMGGIYFWGQAIYEQGGALLSAPSSSVTTAAEIQPSSQQAIKACFSGT
ncbi:MAG: hypothetical protein WB383_05215 [Acidimicrobiales bacterium]